MRVFIFKTGGFGDNYGMGSYINSIISASSSHPEAVSFIIVDMITTTKIEEIVITKKNNISHCKIPLLFNGINDCDNSLFPISIYTTLCDLFNLNTKDIFHFNTSVQFNLGKKIKDELNATIVYTIHFLMWRSLYDTKSIFLKEFKDPKLKSKLIAFHLEQDICKLSKKIICMNSETLAYIKETYGINEKKLIYLPNGLPELIQGEQDESVAMIKNKMGLSNKKIILFVGRIDYHKGVFDLLEVFKTIVINIKDVKLVIVGDGEVSKALKFCDGFWNDVMFTGYVKDREWLNKFYKIADIMILPSYHEQSSFTFLEGIQNKKALIVSNIAAFEKLGNDSCRKIDFVKKRGSERLTINKKQLYNEIVNLITNEKLSTSLAEKAFQIFKKEFNIDNLYNVLIKNVYKTHP